MSTTTATAMTASIKKLIYINNYRQERGEMKKMKKKKNQNFRTWPKCEFNELLLIKNNLSLVRCFRFFVANGDDDDLRVLTSVLKRCIQNMVTNNLHKEL